MISTTVCSQACIAVTVFVWTCCQKAAHSSHPSGMGQLRMQVAMQATHEQSSHVHASGQKPLT